MPFKSEKQRRYLWANEPEIARDWTDTYGSGIAKALGGRIPFAEGSGKTSIPQWNLATLQTALETATSDEERAKIQAQIDRVEGDIGTAADTLLGSGEVPTKGITSKILEFIFGSPAEGSILTEQERIALMDSMKGTTADPGFLYSPRGSQGIMDANVFPTMEANVSDPSLVQAHDFKFGNQWQTAEEEDESDSSNWIIPALSNYFTSKINPAFSWAGNFLPTNLKDSRFYRPATQGAYGYSPAQLNKMNALGGYYSEPARGRRRWEKRQTNILNRAAADKPVGNVNTLLGQHGYQSTPGGGLQFTGRHEGNPSAGAGYSRSDSGWQSSPFRHGGLASLWQR